MLVLKTLKTEEEGLELANDTGYGFGGKFGSSSAFLFRKMADTLTSPFSITAYLYTSDVTRALRVSANLEAGSVIVNGPFMITLNTPFGGLKQSGNGSRESGKAGLMSYLEPKTILIK